MRYDEKIKYIAISEAEESDCTNDIVTLIRLGHPEYAQPGAEADAVYVRIVHSLVSDDDNRDDPEDEQLSDEGVAGVLIRIPAELKKSRSTRAQ